LERGNKSDHLVQFYESDAFLLNSVSDYIRSALNMSDSVILVATKAHLEGFEARLHELGLDVDIAKSCGQYVTLDAADTL
jgi:hypothetical protein